jgi:hypothetical protein
VSPVKSILDLKHVSKSFRVMEKKTTFEQSPGGDVLKAAPQE